MVYINNFGWRLGNQLFQIANAINLAAENNDKVCFPKWKYASMFKYDFKEIKPDSKDRKVYKEKDFNYAPIKYQRNISLHGYFQSEKYFIKSEKIIKEMFTPRNDIADRVTSKNEKLFVKKLPIVSIHVRRGDYLKYPNHHPVITMKYINQAMAKFNENTFAIFSDDIKWCKSNIKGDNIFFIENQTDVEDFVLMSLCDSHIIANSTFSWWPAWLNKNDNKVVIAPKKWFGPAYSHWSTKDLLLRIIYT